ncbi:MAG: DUF192 domain-containing protein [Minisyncoccia bacterium]
MTQVSLLGKILLSALYTSIAVAILATAMLSVYTKKPYKSKVFIAGEEISVFVADTATLRAKGLSGQKSLDRNEGALFVFAEPGLHGFWMKDMYFPIDIIWFDENYQIVDVWERVSPDSYPRVYIPSLKAKFVLEATAGFFSEHNLKIGNTIKITR